MESTRPSAEIWLGSGPGAYGGEVKPEESYLTHELLLQNNLSKGTLTLRSKNPRDLPVINPRFLDDPYDKRIAIETVREAMKVASTGAYESVIEEMVHGPGNKSNVADAVNVDDETILEFVRENLGQGYHFMATCKMGSKNDVTRVVDAQFKVQGVEGLRVADLSVCPVLTW